MDPQRRTPLTVAIDTTPRPNSTLTANVDKFTPSRPSSARKESLLTQALNSGSESPSEEEPELHFSRESSSIDLTSDCGFTSSGTRGTSPSPRLFNFHQLPTVFSKPDFNPTRVAIRTDDDSLSPLDKPTGESNVEANLGRKRCITFACGNKKASTPLSPKVQTPPKAQTPPKTEPSQKRCTIRFACPSKVSTEKPSEDKKPRIARAASPAPALLKQQQEASKLTPRPHRDSDSTVRNDSPKAIRKHHFRKLSSNSDLGKFEATRFHAFGSAEEEVDDWTRESTCHRSRLTVSDTLKIENGLRKLGEEAEEEAIDEDADDDDDMDADDDLDDDDDENVSNDLEEDSDDGFHTDNEAGFASSDDESDADSDFDWWAPGGGASTAATSADHLELIRPSGSRRSFSDSSVGSPESSSAFLAQFKSSPNPLRRRKRRPVDIKVDATPELPDSTDFVCGTLDEDRPLEAAYMSAIERRRAAKHRATPQDIDPTFPTSDPELDEEDEEEAKPSSDNDRHLLMHGSLDSIDSVDVRGRNKKVPTPKRLRSPPPATRRTRSPPPPLRRAATSPVRARSPAPVRRHSLLQSPPAPVRVSNLHFVGMAERPCITIAASLPRAPVSHPISPLLDDDDDNNDLPSRGAIDIKAGLEQKRQRRLQKLYQKHCRKQAKEGEKKPLLPGRGAERMREIGLEIAAYNKSKRAPLPALPAQQPQQDPLIISI